MEQPTSLFKFPTFDANLILVTNDPTPQKFYVHQNILAMASPFFKDMLSLPQPPSESKAIPSIPITDSAPIMELILQLVYPVPNPAIKSLDELVPVLDTALKYDFVTIMPTLRRLLMSPTYLESSPLRVFAIASRFEVSSRVQFFLTHPDHCLAGRRSQTCITIYTARKSFGFDSI